MITQAKKTRVWNQYARHDGDTGSAEVQIAVLTAHQQVNDHKSHKKTIVTTWFDEEDRSPS